jgi:hypothetical protein
MKLIGKRIERLNKFGDNLVIKIVDGGTMRLSPALMSRLRIDANNNKIGFGYPENEDEPVVVYNAIDGDGVAVNKQGYIKNLPHNRDIRSYLELPNMGDTEVYVAEAGITLNEYPGMTFYKVSNTAETVEETTEQWEEEKDNETKIEDTLSDILNTSKDDLRKSVEDSDSEIVEDAQIMEENVNQNQETTDEEDSLDVF